MPLLLALAGQSLLKDSYRDHSYVIHIYTRSPRNSKLQWCLFWSIAAEWEVTWPAPHEYTSGLPLGKSGRGDGDTGRQDHKKTLLINCRIPILLRIRTRPAPLKLHYAII